MFDSINIKIQKAKETGFFHIMISSIIKNILAFIAGIVIVRVISKSDYGIYSYANNIISYFTLFSGLGISSAVFQVCCERRKNGEIPNNIFEYGVTWGHIINAIIGIIIIIYSLFCPSGIYGAEKYLISMSFIPVVNIAFELTTIYFRSKSDNKNYAYVYLVSAVSTFVFSIIGSLIFGVWGMIISNYLTPVIAISFARIKKGYKPSFVVKIEKKDSIDIWKLAITSMTANAISSVMYLIDISMMGLYLKDELEIASYKVATTIPTALVFLATTLVSYVYPYFAEHINDIKWTKSMAKKLLLASCGVFGLISFLLFVLAYPIVTIIFGAQYADAVGVFRILSMSFFFQCTFRIISGNLLVSQRRLKFNLIEGVLTGIINIVGDYFLIQQFKAEGVAMATLIVMIFSGVLATSYYFYVLNKKEKSFLN